MKMEDHFKETLRRAVANEPPVLDAWDRFEDKLRRGRRVRMFAAIAGAAAVIAAAIIVVPQLGSGGGRIVPPDQPGPSDTPTVIGGEFPTDDWNVYRSADGYEVHYPRWWVLGIFEAEVEFHPYWLPGTAAGDPTIATSFQVEHRPMAEVQADPTWASADSFTELGPNKTLIGIIIATDTRLEERYHWIARKILGSPVFNTYNGPGEPIPAPFRHMGSFEIAVPSDARTQALEAFMDARLQGEGRGAEDYLSANALQLYNTEPLHLYDFYKPGLVYYEYQVLSRGEVVDGNASSFVVRIIVAKADGQLGSIQEIFERIEIGPGPNHAGKQRDAVVRSATAQDGP